MTDAGTAAVAAGRDFIRDIIQADLTAKRHGTVVTRFPPEPNGYLRYSAAQHRERKGTSFRGILSTGGAEDYPNAR